VADGGEVAGELLVAEVVKAVAGAPGAALLRLVAGFVVFVANDKVGFAIGWSSNGRYACKPIGLVSLVQLINMRKDTCKEGGADDAS
jgi:hypothetical protein